MRNFVSSLGLELQCEDGVEGVLVDESCGKKTVRIGSRAAAAKEKVQTFGSREAQNTSFDAYRPGLQARDKAVSQDALDQRLSDLCPPAAVASVGEAANEGAAESAGNGNEG
eukprot:3757291-Alexandrium_andersonii.AAC.1